MEEDDDKRRRNLMAFATVVVASSFLGFDMATVVASTLKITAPTHHWRFDLLTLLALAYLLYRYAKRDDGAKKQPDAAQAQDLLIRGWPDKRAFLTARREMLATLIASDLKRALERKVRQQPAAQSLPEALADHSVFDVLCKSANLQPYDEVLKWNFYVTVPDLTGWQKDAPPWVQVNLVANTAAGMARTGEDRISFNEEPKRLRYLLGVATLRTGLLTSLAVDRLTPYYIALPAAAVPAGRLLGALVLAIAG